MVFDTAAGELPPASFDATSRRTSSGWRGAFRGQLGYFATASASGASGAGADCRRAVGGPRRRLALGSRLVLARPRAGFVQGNFDPALLLLRSRVSTARSTSSSRPWPRSAHRPAAAGSAGSAMACCRRRRKPASAVRQDACGGRCNEPRSISACPRIRRAGAALHELSARCRTGTTRRRRSSGSASLGRAHRRADASLALYVHMPFCESLCTFCGCNTVITRDHRHEDSYVDLVLRRARRISRARAGARRRPSRQLHLGGGTPTFLSPAALDRLMTGLSARLGRCG